MKKKKNLVINLIVKIPEGFPTFNEFRVFSQN